MTFPLAEAVPVAPAAGYTVVGLGALIAFVVSWGLAHSWGATFGRFLRWLGGKEIKASVHHIGFVVQPFGFALTLDHDVQAWLSQAMALSERAMVHSFTEAYKWATLTVTAPFHLGEATYSALARLYHAAHVTVPRVVRETIVRPVTRTITRTVVRVEARTVNLAHELARARIAIRHATAVAVHSVAVTLPRVGHLERTGLDVRGLPKWLKRHLTALLVGGVLVRALAKLGMGWLRCRNVKKVGNRVCGLDPSMLESLLGETLLVTSALSIVEFARALEQPTELVTDGLRHFIREF